MPAKNLTGWYLITESKKAVIATHICSVTNFTQLKLTNIQANYLVGQMHCGPSNQNFGWAMANQAHTAAPPLML